MKLMYAFNGCTVYLAGLDFVSHAEGQSYLSHIMHKSVLNLYFNFVNTQNVHAQSFMGPRSRLI